MKLHTPARAVLLASLLAAAPAAAQEIAADGPVRSTTRGFVLGIHPNATGIQLDGEGTGGAENGFGAGLMLGYGVSNAVTVFARVDGANVAYDAIDGESYAVVHLDLGGRYSFGSRASALRPFAELSLQGVGVSDEIEGDEVTLSGGAFGLAGGLEYFVSRRVAIEGSIGVSKGKLTNAAVNGEEVDDISEDFTSTRLNIGISWHP